MSGISRYTDEQRATLRGIAANPKLRDQLGDFLVSCQKLRDMSAESLQRSREHVANWERDLETAEANLSDVQAILSELSA